MATKQLRKITQEEFDKALQDHFLYQKGDESKQMIFKNCNFSGIRLVDSDLSGAIFDGSDFRNAINTDSYLRPTSTNYGNQFKECTLDNVSFRNCDLQNIKFTFAKSLKGAIFIGAEFNPRFLSDEQKKQIFATEKELELTKKSIKQETVIENKEKVIEKKNQVIEKTSKDEAKGMLEIFSGLRLSFFREELLWMIFSFCIFLIIFSIAETIVAFMNPGLATIILFGLFGGIMLVGVILSWIGDVTEQQENDTSKRTVGTIILSIFKTIGVLIFSGIATYVISVSIEKWDKVICKTSDAQNCLSMEKVEISMLPITFILLSILWFSVHQYGRAKKLRIEQQNKQAMIHFMQAVIAQDGKGSYAERSFPQLAPFFANAIIHRPFSQENYEPQLPIDELFKLANNAKDLVK